MRALCPTGSPLLCNVFVNPGAYGQGIGAAFLEGIMDAFEPLNLKRMVLAMANAHDRYAKFGFEPLCVLSQWMQRAAQQITALT